MINTKEKNYTLFGAGVDVSSEDLALTYRSLTEIYNQIQKRRDDKIEEKAQKPALKIPQLNIQRPQIDLPQIKIQSPIAFGKKKEDDLVMPVGTDIISTEEKSNQNGSELE